MEQINSALFFISGFGCYLKWKWLSLHGGLPVWINCVVQCSRSWSWQLLENCGKICLWSAPWSDERWCSSTWNEKRWWDMISNESISSIFAMLCSIAEYLCCTYTVYLCCFFLLWFFLRARGSFLLSLFLLFFKLVGDCLSYLGLMD